MSGRSRPNIIIILADDLGFSDISCFGSEISTPNIDSLANNDGIRFTQMYNCARCCPSRSSLLTGKYPHQAGIGHMVYDAEIGGEEYQGYLRRDVATIAEILKREHTNTINEDSSIKTKKGYAAFMVGKWHVGGEYPPDATHEWIQSILGDETHPIPTQRGFDHFYGTLGGGGSYYQPPSLVRDDKVITETIQGYYYTDAINDEVCEMIEDMSKKNEDTDEQQPFFMYVSHTAPHWPLHAPKDDIDKCRGKYMQGWDKIREERHAKLIEQGIIPSTWKCSPRDVHSPPWEEVENKAWEDARMSTYAAQVEIMDRGIGRILDTLKRTDTYDNTVIFFLSDNGGCAEYLNENGDEGHWSECYGGLTREGRQIKLGNTQDIEPGEEDTFMSYGLPWANVSNAPFRLFKAFVHEGGTATPFVVNWPAAMSKTEASDSIKSKSIRSEGRMCHSPWILMDIVATCCDLAGLSTDEIEGESFLSILQGKDMSRKQPIFWEHQGNRAVRDGKWKLVHKRCNEEDADYDGRVHGWELYNMEEDRTELNNLASSNEERVSQMAKLWLDWAARIGVKQWPLKPLPEGEKDWSNVPHMW